MGDIINGNKYEFGDNSRMINIQVNIGDKDDKKKSTEKPEEVEDAEYTETEEKQNLSTPRIVLQNMLQEDWVDTVCRNTKLYTKEWRSKMVEELMASEYGSSIAKDWMLADKRQKIKAELLGTLSYAGVLDNNKSAIARAYLDIDKNTRDKNEKREVNTLGNYIGLGKNALYHDWVKDYVESTTKNS